MKCLGMIGIAMMMLLSLAIPAFAVDSDENSPVQDYASARIIGAGTVLGDNVNVRTGPGTNYSVITQVNKGDRVGVLHFTKDENSSDPNEFWFYCIISSTGERGYIYMDYVLPDEWAT